MEILELAKKNKKTSDDEELSRRHYGKRKPVRTMPFILANQVCDRFAASVFHANIITYLTQVLNLPLVEASNTVSNFGGVSSFAPIIGAFVADSFLGRFRTIILGSIINVMGMVTITIFAVVPNFRPPPCPTRENCQEASNLEIWFLCALILLASLGSGCIKPCVVTFAADQFDMIKSKAESRSWNFFDWYYFCMAIASLIALTVIVYVQDNISWAWGLGIPTIAMALSLVAFVSGGPMYKKINPCGSPFVRVAQVIVAAIRKRKLVGKLDDDDGALYENKELDSGISVHGRLLRSNQFKWLDHAAVVTDSDKTEESSSKGKTTNLWRLGTVHRVEELKSILGILPICAASILSVASQSHLSAFTAQQALTMDRNLWAPSSFRIPATSTPVLGTLTVIAALPLYECLFVPFARLLTRNPAGVTCLQRMGIGLSINVFATITSALVEIKRKGMLGTISMMSVLWLGPQYVLHGVAEVFMAVGHLEFLYDQSPESMRTTAAALYWIAMAMGNFVGAFMVSLVRKYTNGKWLPDDGNLDKGKLENYYWVVMGVQVVNLVYYVVCAWFYEYKALEKVIQDDEDEDVELGVGGNNTKPPLVEDEYGVV